MLLDTALPESTSQNSNTVCPESTIESANRRDFVRKAVAVTAAAGVGGILLGSGRIIPNSSAKSNCCPPVRAYCARCYGVKGGSCTGDGVRGCSTKGDGVFGCSPCGTGVYGKGKNYGLHGKSCIGPGAYGVSSTNYGVRGCSTCSNGVWGSSAKASGIRGNSKSNYGVHGCSPCNVGVLGTGKVYGVQGCATGSCVGSAGIGGFANKGGSSVTAGVYGTSNSTSGQGVSGYASASSGNTIGVVGKVNSPGGTGVFGCSLCGPAVSGCSFGGIGVLGSVSCGYGIPLVAKGTCCQSSPLQEWQNSSGSPLAVVSKCGAIGLGVTTPSRKLCVSGRGHISCGLGLGTQTINTTLAVNGSIAAKARTAANNCQGKMTASDFAVFANGATKVVLPPAGTQTGMMVFVKNAASSAISVAPAGCDSIEGLYKASSPISLGKKNDSLQLISNGSSPGEWYVLSGVKCGSVVS